MSKLSKTGIWFPYSELERLDQSDSLIHGTSDGQVIDGDLTENALGVNDEQATESDTLFLDENIVIP